MYCNLCVIGFPPPPMMWPGMFPPQAAAPPPQGGAPPPQGGVPPPQGAAPPTQQAPPSQEATNQGQQGTYVHYIITPQCNECIPQVLLHLMSRLQMEQPLPQLLLPHPRECFLLL